MYYGSLVLTPNENDLCLSNMMSSISNEDLILISLLLYREK
jgi:hypothetical protein